MSGTLVRCDDRVALEAALGAARASAEAIAFVPTMGALHVGHLTLVRRAATLAPTVVVSIFVNPTQFDVAADLAAYPRTLDDDLAQLAALAATLDASLIVYTPSVDDVYPDGAARTLRVLDVTDHLCGASRPGHFDGVATVVDALLRAVRPTVVVMGRKDHQQLVVVRRLVAMQGYAVAVDAAPTVRDHDGVATSSRNRLLDDAARAVARRIPAALAAGVAVARSARVAGTALDPVGVRDAATAVLAGDGLRIDYLETVDPDRIVPIERPIARPGGGPGEGPDARQVQVLLAVAAHVGGGEGTVRLIDNVLLGDAADEQRLLDALSGTAEPRAARDAGRDAGKDEG
jgi:pantoate--beta-alanine ligase